MTSPTPNVTKIFQYWNTKKPPHEVYRMMRTWKNHSGYRMFLYDEKKARTFIRNNFSKEIYKAFCICAIPAMQADFFRYCALYKFGGMYVDADIRISEGKFDELRALLDESDKGLIMTREGAVANDLIYIRDPESPLIKKVIDAAVKNIQTRKSNNVWEVTGPGIMSGFQNSEAAEDKALFKGYSFKSFKVMREIVEFKWNLNYKEDEGHWTVAQEKRSIFKLSNKVFCVGFNKTGTSSLHEYFKYHKLKSLHNMIWPEATHYLKNKRLYTFLNNYQCFSDGEMANLERIYKMYPNANYILNTRDLEDWLKSRVKWVHRLFPKATNGPMAIEYKKLKYKAFQVWTRRKVKYEQKVISFFEDKPGKLLILDVCNDPNWIEQLNSFLGLGGKIDPSELHKNAQKIQEMNENKQRFLKSRFTQITNYVAMYNENKSASGDSLKFGAIYKSRINLIHLVKRRFGKTAIKNKN